MPMSPQVLANLRQKYPQYNDIDDATLSAKVIAKYPEYDDPIPSSPIPQNVAGLPPGQAPPGFPAAPPVNMKPSDVGQIFGDPGTYAGVPAKHITNMVKGIGGIAAPAQNGGELAASAFGPAALPAYRALVQPSIQPLKDTANYAKQGNWEGARQSIINAVPIAGPWGKAVEDEAKSEGGVPAALGLATDYAAPIGASKALGLAARGAGAVSSAIGKIGEYAGATKDARALANTRFLVPGESGDVLTRALKPSISSKVGPSNLTSSLPDILKQNPNPQNLGEFGSATDAAREAKNTQYAAWRDPHANTPLDTTSMVQPQMNSIPATNRFETPGIIDTTARQASPYDMTPREVTTTSPILDQFGKPITNTEMVSPQKPTLGTVDEIRKDTNAKLNSFYNKEMGDQNAAMSNPGTARIKAVNDSSRNLVYKNLAEFNDIPESDIRANQNAYGTLSEIGDVAGNRENVFGRHDPISLPEKIAVSHGVKNALIDYGTQKFLKNTTDSNALIRSGVDRFNNPISTPLPTRSDLFARGTAYTGRAAQEFGKGASETGKAISSGRNSYLIPPKKKKS